MTTDFAEIDGHDRWCVTTAIAALTGIDTDTLRCLIVGLSYSQIVPWEGVEGTDTFTALSHLGIDCEISTYRNGKRPTLSDWLAANDQGCYLIGTAKHMMPVQNGIVGDNGEWAEEWGVDHTEIDQPGETMDWVACIKPADRPQPPQWAVTAGTRLKAERDKHGPQAQINHRWIKALRQQERGW